jgi:hypothetical protein
LCKETAKKSATFNNKFDNFPVWRPSGNFHFIFANIECHPHFTSSIQSGLLQSSFIKVASIGFILAGKGHAVPTLLYDFFCFSPCSTYVRLAPWLQD